MSQPHKDLTLFCTKGLFDQPFSVVLEHTDQTSSGTYQYDCDGESTDINEAWSEHLCQDGSTIVNCQRNAASFGSYIRVQSRSSRGNIDEFMVQWRQRVDHEVITLDAHYFIGETHTTIKRRVQDELYEYAFEIDQRNIAICPLMRIYYGDTIDWLYRQGEPRLVMMPWIQKPNETDRMLEMQLSQRSAIAVNGVSVDAPSSSARCFNYRGDQYDDSALFWLADNNRLLRYQWNQSGKLWQVNLRVNDK